MKAVFVVRECLLRGSDGHGLSEAMGAAMRGLLDQDFFLVLLGVGTGVQSAGQARGDEPTDEQLVEWVGRAGGRVDALASCPHVPSDACFCWGSQPGLLWETARDLDIHLDESYLICYGPTDVLMGYAAGCRPILVLTGRTIEEIYDGFQPEPADFPVALDLERAADYIVCEDEIAAGWGHPRAMVPVSLEDGESLLNWPDGIATDALPVVTAFSPLKVKLPVRTAQLVRNSGRALLLVVVGGVWLSLGIAYLLTHLYRVRPFPEFVWYLTLQFVPRPVRGLLFISTGLLILFLALRSVRKAVPSLRWGKPPES